MESTKLWVRSLCRHETAAVSGTPAARRWLKIIPSQQGIPSDTRGPAPACRWVVAESRSDARFEEVDFTGTWFRNVYFVGATLRGAWREDVDIDGEIRNVRINGVEVGPLVEAELDRRNPERTKLHPTDADGFREAWAVTGDIGGSPRWRTGDPVGMIMVVRTAQGPDVRVVTLSAG
jgi:hypothetical protein